MNESTTQPQYFIGLDLGGTKTEAIVVECLVHSPSEVLNQNQLNVNILGCCRAPTGRLQGYDAILDVITHTVQTACHQAGIFLDRIAAWGLSVPGPVNPQSNQITISNTMVLAGKNIAADLCARLQIKTPMVLENDANCFILAESVFGAGRIYATRSGLPTQQHIGIGVTLGSSCGGGVVIKGQLLRGRNGYGAEFGHMQLYNPGHTCYCGQQGCAEQYISGPALEALMATRLYAQIEGRPSAPQIFDLCEKKDPIALAVVRKYKNDLALFLAQLVHIFDPDYIVLGGGLSSQPEVYQGLSQLMTYHLINPMQAPAVYRYGVGDSAGSLGAVLVALEYVSKSSGSF